MEALVRGRACIMSVNPTQKFPSANKLTSVVSHSVIPCLFGFIRCLCLSVFGNSVEILCIFEASYYQISFKLVSSFKMDGEMDTDNYIKLTFFCELSSFIIKIHFPAQVTLSPFSRTFNKCQYLDKLPQPEVEPREG